MRPNRAVSHVDLISECSLGQVEANEQLNFKHIFDSDNDIYGNNHYCEYVEINPIANLTKKQQFFFIFTQCLESGRSFR